MDFPLPDFVHAKKTKYRIYGTGEVAASYYRSINSLYGEDSVSCFIDSSRSKTVFNGKKVFQANDLEKASLNDYIYLLGSYTSESSMRAELLKVGVDKKNIIDNRFSIGSFNKIDIKINTISIYPIIDTNERLEVIRNKMKFFLPKQEDYKVIINVFCAEHLINDKRDGIINHVAGVEKSYIDSSDLVLVWDRKALSNEDIKNHDNVYCIDPAFFQFIDTKILIELNNKLCDKETSHMHYNVSYKNFKDFYNKYLCVKKAFVFGNGPSLKEGIKRICSDDFKESLRVVCNGSINNEEIINMIKPNVYVISDVNHFIYDMQKQMVKIVDYIDNNECMLFVPNSCYLYMIKKYTHIESKIVGITEDSLVINFPNPDNPSVLAKAHNVITRFSIPIVSALSSNVIIVGCDGVEIADDDNKRFEHYSGTASELELEKTNETHKQRNSYFVQHYSYFKELVDFGESKGIRYTSLTKSYIPVLKDRYYH